MPDEGTFINTVYRLVTGTRPAVYHLTGHGEHRLDSEERGGYSGYAEVLHSQGYRVRPLLFSAPAAVPADADVVVISAPKLDPSPDEIAALDAFLAEGGAILALLDPGTGPALTDWAARYNVRLGNDVIVTARSERREAGLSPRVVVVSEVYPEHPITRGLPGLPTLFPFAQTLSPVQDRLPGVAGFNILLSGPGTWAETDPATQVTGEPRFDEGVDVAGPVSFGVALEVDRDRAGRTALSDGPRRRPSAGVDPVDDALASHGGDEEASLPASIFTETETARLVIVGDSDFAVNENLHRYGNRDLLLNLLGWLAREKVLIGLRAPASVAEPVVLTARQKEWIGWGCILGWPLLVAGISVLLVLRRRRA
jgi:ABC-type uncharacterized transport system involved in gliding motility auxiliary subunit